MTAIRVPDAVLRTVRRPRVWWRLPRGWVLDLLNRRPQREAFDVLEVWGDVEPDELTDIERAAVECANYVISIPAAYWDHGIAHPVRRPRRTNGAARR